MGLTSLSSLAELKAIRESARRGALCGGGGGAQGSDALSTLSAEQPPQAPGSSPSHSRIQTSAEAPEKLAVALEQLPLHSEGRQAAAVVELAISVRGPGGGGYTLFFNTE